MSNKDIDIHATIGEPQDNEEGILMSGTTLCFGKYKLINKSAKEPWESSGVPKTTSATGSSPPCKGIILLLTCLTTSTFKNRVPENITGCDFWSTYQEGIYGRA